MLKEQNIERTTIIPLLNAPTLNQLFSLNSRMLPSRINPLLDDVASFNFKGGTLFVSKSVEENPLKVSSLKMLDFLIYLLGKNNNYKPRKDEKVNTTVDFSLIEYAEVLGRKNIKSNSTKKDVRKIIKDALEILKLLSFETAEKRGKEMINFSKIKILQSYSLEVSVFNVVFTESFVRYLLSSYVMKFPLNLFCLDERNKNAYTIGRKLFLHQSIKRNKSLGIENVISVKKLLEAAPLIPSIEEVRKKNWGWESCIRDKLDHTLDLLQDEKILENWEYCSDRGEPLTDEQLFSMHRYNVYEKLKVLFRIQGFEIEK